jgi:hypothetical protein
MAERSAAVDKVTKLKEQLEREREKQRKRLRHYQIMAENLKLAYDRQQSMSFKKERRIIEKLNDLENLRSFEAGCR